MYGGIIPETISLYERKVFFVENVIQGGCLIKYLMYKSSHDHPRRENH